jgi:ferrous iron transport protein B
MPATARPPEPEATPRPLRVALVGNPNSGKTTLFNALTGLRQKVGNYPGVTVEKKEGEYTWQGRRVRLLDLPGTYSLKAASDDERVVRDVLLSLQREEQPVDLAVIVVDASHLERNLFLATQVMDLGLPVVLVLTMNDEAEKSGLPVETARLADALHAPVVEVYAPRLTGIDNLKQAIAGSAGRVPPAPPWRIGEQVLGKIDELAGVLEAARPGPQGLLREAALQILLDDHDSHPLIELPDVHDCAHRLRAELEAAGVNWRQAEATGRYHWIREVVAGARLPAPRYQENAHDRLDHVLTHPVVGLAVFILVMGVVFQAVFSWSGPFMEAIDSLFGWLGGLVAAWVPAGPLQGLLVDGVVGGVGGVVIFLPQILLLFLFVAILEDSGYMARAAFLMNRHMRRAGLHGRAFIPLLTGFACSIPAIMATRAIANRRDRLVTILVVPFISCGARLPVYTLMIGAFIPAAAITRLLPGFTWQGLTLWLAYLFSLATAITAAWALRKTVLPGETQPFILELPPYRWPNLRTVFTSMWERGRVFLTQAGTIILAINILLWFLLSLPANPPLSPAVAAEIAQAQATLSGAELEARVAQLEGANQIQSSIAGRLGKLIEPVIAPLGFDWKIGIGIIGSFAAREVFVSTMAVIYGMGEDEEAKDMAFYERLQRERDPHTGKPVYNMLVAINLIIYFILACQCMATIAIVKRETASWKWALFMLAYMTGTAWIVCCAFYQAASHIWPGLVAGAA